MENPEVLIALIGIATAAIGALSLRADQRSRRAVQRAEQARKDLAAEKELALQRAEQARKDLATEKELALQREKLLAETTQALIGNLRAELDRHEAARARQDKTHTAQIARFDKLVAGQAAQIEGMERLYEEESNRRKIEREEMAERIDAQGTQIADLNEQINGLLIELDAGKRREDDLQKEREKLLERIQALEKAQSDGNVPVAKKDPRLV